MRPYAPAKWNLFLRLAGAMAVFTIATACMTSGLFARYATTAVQTDGVIRVSKFQVTTSLPEDNKTILLSENALSGTYSFSIQNDSEVTIEYDVIVTLPSNSALPSNISLTMNDAPVSVSDDGLIYTFSPDTLVLSGNSSDVVLTVTANTEALGTAIDLSDITVQVKAKQVY